MESRSIECLVQQVVSCLLSVLLARAVETLGVRIHSITHAIEEKGPRCSQSVLPFRVVHKKALLFAGRLMLHGDAKCIAASNNCIIIELSIMLSRLQKLCLMARVESVLLLIHKASIVLVHAFVVVVLMLSSASSEERSLA